MNFFDILPQLSVSDRNFASCEQCLREKSITHVLTVDAEKLTFIPCFKHDQSIVEIEHKECLLENKLDHLVVEYAYALDVPSFNILNVLATCLPFMKQSLNNGSKKLLVHCHAGQSRSVAVVTAYLMNTKLLSADECLQLIQSKHQDALPNPGFLSQLKLFQHMGNKIDHTSHVYQQFNMQQQYQSKKSITNNVERIVNHSSTTRKYCALKCRLCRCELLTSADIQTGHETCSSWHLIEPVHWMIKNDVQGKICCFKCSGKLGTYHWAGNPCSCGEWMTPSFQIHKSRVDVTKTFEYLAVCFFE